MILAFLVFILSCNILPWNWDLVTFKKFFAFKNFLNIFYTTRASLVTQMVKNPLAMWETGFDPWVGKIPGGRHGNPLQYSCLENPHEQRNLVGYTPWGGKESDITERLSTAHTTFKGNFPFTVIRKYWLFPPLKKKKAFIYLAVLGLNCNMQGLSLGPLHCECGVFTTGPQEMSLSPVGYNISLRLSNT